MGVENLTFDATTSKMKLIKKVDDILSDANVTLETKERQELIDATKANLLLLKNEVVDSLTINGKKISAILETAKTQGEIARAFPNPESIARLCLFLVGKSVMHINQLGVISQAGVPVMEAITEYRKNRIEEKEDVLISEKDEFSYVATIYGGAFKWITESIRRISNPENQNRAIQELQNRVKLYESLGSALKSFGMFARAENTKTHIQKIQQSLTIEKPILFDSLITTNFIEWEWVWNPNHFLHPRKETISLRDFLIRVCSDTYVVYSLEGKIYTPAKKNQIADEKQTESIRRMYDMLRAFEKKHPQWDYKTAITNAYNALVKWNITSAKSYLRDMEENANVIFNHNSNSDVGLFHRSLGDTVTASNMIAQDIINSPDKENDDIKTYFNGNESVYLQNERYHKMALMRYNEIRHHLRWKLEYQYFVKNKHLVIAQMICEMAQCGILDAYIKTKKWEGLSPALEKYNDMRGTYGTWNLSDEWVRFTKEVAIFIGVAILTVALNAGAWYLLSKVAVGGNTALWAIGWAMEIGGTTNWLGMGGKFAVNAIETVNGFVANRAVRSGGQYAVDYFKIYQGSQTPVNIKRDIGLSFLNFAGFSVTWEVLKSTQFMKHIKGTSLEKTILLGGDAAISAIIQTIDTGVFPAKLSDWAHFIGTSLAFRAGNWVSELSAQKPRGALTKTLVQSGIRGTLNGLKQSFIQHSGMIDQFTSNVISQNPLKSRAILAAWLYSVIIINSSVYIKKSPNTWESVPDKSNAPKKSIHEQALIASTNNDPIGIISPPLHLSMDTKLSV